MSRCSWSTVTTDSAAPPTRPTSQSSWIPDSATRPSSASTMMIVTPRSGSLATSTIGTNANTAARPTARSLGRPLAWRISLRNIAPIRMMAILPNSEGSIWKLAGSVIQDLEPLTGVPSGVSTAISPSRDNPYSTGAYRRSLR